MAMGKINNQTVKTCLSPDVSEITEAETSLGNHSYPIQN
jgi:hypothetical protein